ncbi:hypothetical protein NV226_03000 [Mycoplasma iguanae]|uniref:Uncharacterized protein n=1 Tax=Mycoplasma iguanae TaxID=292461 RepID=A0ABY5RA77_9MOLU|nr:hypothetical protein [Mycoplasma iguanae]UVD81667.1 hypothetical protein NV226_03000 [Mycoplasma iguanae]
MVINNFQISEENLFFIEILSLIHNFSKLEENEERQKALLLLIILRTNQYFKKQKA